MLYDSYVKKVKKLIRFRDWLIRYRFILASIFLIITAGTITFLSSVGSIQVIEKIEENVEYGSDFILEAKAFLKEVIYEYRVKGTSEWTTEKPTEIGNYESRVTSKGIFGGQISSEIFEFSITKKKVTLSPMSGILTYGDDLQLIGELAYSDKAYAIGFAIDVETLGEVNFDKSFTNIKIYDKDNKDVTQCYDIELIDKKIQLLPRKITVKIDTAEKEFDGTPLTSNIYSLSSGNLIGNSNLSLNFTTSITEVGTVLNDADVKVLNEKGTDVSSLYEITKDIGNLVVKPRKLDITTGSETFTYNDIEYFNNKFEVQNGLDNYIVECTGYETFIDAGEYENKLQFKVTTKDGVDVTSNFEFNQTSGVITINKKDISLTSKDTSVVYCATVPDYIVDLEEYDLGIKNHTLEINKVNNENYIIPNEYQNTFEVVISNGEDDVTKNYNISYNYGKLIIEKRSIKIKTATTIFTYNGQDQSDEGYEIISELGICSDAGHKIMVVDAPSIRNVGSIENTYSIDIILRTGESVKDYYNVEYEYGTITVEKRSIKIQTNSNLELIYSDEEQFDDGFETIEGEIVSGHTTIVNDYKTIKYVGELENVFTIDIFDGDEKVTNNYDISYVYGTLKVNKKQIKFSTKSDEKEYDDTPLLGKESDIQFIEGFELIANHTYKLVQNFVSITDVGTEINVLKIEDILDASGNSVFENYEIIEDNSLFGTLTIKHRPVTILMDSKEKEYDGIELTCETFTYVEGSLVEGHKFDLGGFSSIVNKGEISNDVTKVLVLKNDTDVTKNYNITVQKGTLKITARYIEVGSLDATKEYDGIIIENKKYSTINGSLVNGHELVVTKSTNFKDVNELENVFEEYIITDKDGVDVTTNYEIKQVQYGTLKITKRSITVQTGSATLTYNGKEQCVEQTNNIVVKGQLAATDKIEVDVYSKFIDAFEEGYKNETTFKITHSDGSLVTDNYDITYEYGIIVILKAEIKVKPLDEEFTYDGKFHMPSSIEFIENTSLCSGHVFGNITYLGEIKNVGSISTEIDDIEILDGAGNPVTKNYNVVKEKGNISITKRSIEIGNTDLVFTYDGTYKTVDTANFSIKNKILEHKYEFTLVNSINEKNAGTYEFTFDLVIYEDENVDVTSNYEFVLPKGSLTINKKEIRINTVTEEIEYDGQEHTSFDFDLLYQIDHVLGHQVIFDDEDYGRITNVGKVENKLIVAKILDENNEDVISNYDIKYYYGEIIITPRKITVLTGSDEKQYDDIDLIVDTIEVISDTKIVEGQEYEIDYDTITKARYYKVDPYVNKFTIKIYDGETDVTSNYEIEYQYGSIQILKRDLNLNTGSISTVYNGTDIYCNDVEYIDLSQFIEGQQLTVTEYKKFRNVGNYVNDEFKIQIKNKDNVDVTYCYNIVYENYGTIEILVREIEIKTKSFIFYYNGEEHSYPELESNLLDNSSKPGVCGNDKFLVLSDTKITYVGTKTNKLEFDIIDENGNSVVSNYDFDDRITYGTLEVKSKSSSNILAYKDNFSSTYKEEKFEANQLVTLNDGTAFLRPGYEIIGWTTDSSALEVEYDLGAQARFSESTVLYAVWEEIDAPQTIIIQYIYMDKTIIDTTYVNEPIKLSDGHTFQKEGYTLIGWATIPDAKEVKYNLNDTYSFEEDQTLYPVWVEVYMHILCPICGLCMDQNCENPDEEKCSGHAHEHITCPICGLCIDDDCDGLDSDKCPGHAEHIHKPCSECGKCIDVDCDGLDSDKCPGHAEHIHTPCLECGKCIDVDCDGLDSDKCPGHAEHIHTPCLECGKCIDVDCDGDETDKCLGHKEIVTIIYNPNDGIGDVQVVEVEKGILVDLYDGSNFEKDGYYLIGWSIDKNNSLNIYELNKKYIFNEDVTLYAVWDINPIDENIYIDYFIDINDSIGTTQEVEINKKVYLYGSNTFEKEGYRLIGWTTTHSSNVVDYNFDELYCFDSDITLYGVWEEVHVHLECSKCGKCTDANCDAEESEKCQCPEQITIIYNANGGNGENIVETYDINSEVELLSGIEFERTDYILLGWSTSKNATEIEFELSSKHVFDKNITLYAVWAEEIEKIDIYYYKEKDSTETDIRTVNKGQPTTLLGSSTFMKEGYTIIGWTTSDLGDFVTYEFNVLYTFEEDITLYAVWKENHKHIECKNCGLCNDPKCNGLDSLKCKCITISYYPNGGSGEVFTQLVVKGTNFELYNGELFIKVDHTLLGWSTSKETIEVMYELSSMHSFNQNTTLYAVWKENHKHTECSNCGLCNNSVCDGLDSEKCQCILITYDPNNGEGEVFTQPVGKDASFELYNGETFVREGYELIGWSTIKTNNEYVEFNLNEVCSFNDDSTLYAVWHELKIDEIIYIYYYSDQFDQIGVEQKVVKGKETILLGNDTFEKVDYTLIGWSTVVNASEVEYKLEEACFFEDNCTLFAVWKLESNHVHNPCPDCGLCIDPECDGLYEEKCQCTGHEHVACEKCGLCVKEDCTGTNSEKCQCKEEISVIYKPNGGEEDVIVDKKEKGKEFTLRNKKTFTKEGYTLVGWSTSKSATQPTYEVNATVSFDHNVTLYAVWLETEIEEIITIYYCYDLFDEEGFIQKIIKGESFKMYGIDTFEKHGYILIGWSTDFEAKEAMFGLNNEYTYSDIEDYIDVNNMTLYAVWEEIPAHEHTLCEVCDLCIDINCDGLDADKCHCIIITFNSNGGNGIIESAKIEPYSEFVLPSGEELSKEGYTLIGWALKKDTVFAKYHLSSTQIFDKNTTLYAVWEKDLVIVDIIEIYYFKDATNENGYIQKIEKGVSINLYDETMLEGIEFNKEGYILIGWSTVPDDIKVEYELGELKSFNDNITLYAVWEEIIKCKHTQCDTCGKCTNPECDGELEGICNCIRISYNANGGEGSIKTQVVERGSIVKLSDGYGLSYEDYKLIGWSEDRYSKNTKYHLSSEILFENDVTLYAVWIIDIEIDELVDITYLSDILDDKGIIKSIHKGIPNKVLMNDVFEKEGYNLIGWSTSPNSQTIEYICGKEYSFSENTTLYAVWEEIIKCKHTPCDTCGKCTNPECDGLDSDKCQCITQIHKHTPCENCGLCIDPECDGLDSDKCQCIAQIHKHVLCEICELCIDEKCDGEDDVRCKGHKDIINITYKPNGGSGDPHVKKYDKGSKLQLSDGTEFTREGYTLIGWSTSKNDNRAIYKLESEQVFDNNITLYAVWIEDIKIDELIEIIYLYDESGKNPVSIKALKDQEILLEGNDTFKKEGYQLIGWSKTINSEEAEFKFGVKYKFQESVTLYPVWRYGSEHIFEPCEICGKCTFEDCQYEHEKCLGHKEIYNIIYNANGGAGQIDSVRFEKGQEVVLSNGEGIQRDGYTLIGWSNKANAVSAKYKLGETYTFTGDTTLFAVWSEDHPEVKEDILIKYLSNNEENIYKYQTAYKNEMIELLGKLTFIKEGYVIVGWAEYPNATIPKYQVNQKISFTSDTILYAVWGENNSDGDVPTDDILFDDSGKLSSNGNDSQGKDIIAFSFTSSKNGIVYFRQKSFGDYQETKWLEMNQEFDFTAYDFNPIFLVSKILEEHGFDLNEITIEIKLDDVDYLLPYYCINDSIEGSEHIFELLVDGIYTLEYIDFNIFDVSNSIVTTIYNEYELAYREFVYNNYLQIC